MTQNNKIVITTLDNKLILCRIKDDKPVDAYAYDGIGDEFPVGTIVNAVVKKHIKGMDCSFIDYAPHKSGYINGEYKCESMIPVMYKKEPVGEKKPLFTDKISITDEYAVIFDDKPFIKVSSKISKDRQNELLDKYREYSEQYNVGILLRTSCAKPENEPFIIEHIIRNCEIINNIRQNANHRVAYSILHRPSPQIVIDILELIQDGVTQIVTDNDDLFEILSKTISDNMLTDRVELRKYEDNMLPLSKVYGFEGIISEILSRIIYLKSGGNIRFDYTEALTAIDVNSAGFKYKGDRDDAVLQLNIEACSEIFRQIRLRNISGIILVDLINMKSKECYNILSEKLRELASKDKYNCTFHGFTNLGLAEISRKKVRVRFAEQLR